jgi:signal transduction histidine kinase
MSWITVVWPIIVGACLTLAAMHLLVWMKDRRAGASFAFAGIAVCVACIAAFELALTRAETPEQFSSLRSWSLAPVFVGFICILIFVRMHLQAGRLWLAHLTWVVRLAGLIFNSISPPHLFYRELTGVRQVDFFGATVTVAQGVPSPWLWLDQLSVLLLVTYVIDAACTGWSRGGVVERRRAAVVGGSLVFFLFVAGSLMTLASWLVIAAPYLVAPAFMIMVCAMGYELSRDVLRATQLARDLRESERRMELAAGAARLGLWTWDMVRDEIWATDKALELYGLIHSDRLNFQRFLQSLHPDDQEPVNQAVAKATKDGGDFESEYRVMLPGRGERWLAARGRVEFDDKKQPVRMRGISIDITERRRTEQEVAQHRAELAHLTRVHTLGELSGSLAHELNQPLGIILTNAQAARHLLEREPPDVPEVRDILGDIVAADLRAGEVIQRLRALLKRGEISLQPVSLNDVIDEVLKLANSDLIGRGVVVDRDLAAVLPQVNGDRVQLQQLLLNLVVNAADAMVLNTPGARRLHLKTELQSEMVRASVRDEGIGLPADPERLFEAFFSTKSHGLGMGLTICRSIAKAHRGNLWAQPHPGGGAVFNLELPVVGPVKHP